MTTLYDVKVFFSGNVIEIYKYSETRAIGYERAEKTVKQEGKKLIDFETGEIITEDGQKLESRKKSNIRARNTLRRIISSNFNNNSKFLTLTFRENLQDIEEANRCFKLFTQNMNRHLKSKDKPKLLYAAVIEYQKRGAIHYHLICNLKGVGANTIRDCWKRAVGKYEGNIDIKNIRHVDNVGAYLVKYMTKADADERLIGKKLYQTSRGLKKPKELGLSLWKEKDKKILDSLLKGKKITYQDMYEDKHTGGTVNYLEINLSRQGI